MKLNYLFVCFWVIIMFLSLIFLSVKDKKYFQQNSGEHFVLAKSQFQEESDPGYLLDFSLVEGSLSVDGKLDDQVWKSVSAFPLVNLENAPMTTRGGEARIAVRGDYLIMSARLPEWERIVALSTGVNPNWGSNWSNKWGNEDILVWSICARSPIQNLVKSFSLTVNPYGAYSLLGLRGFVTETYRQTAIGEERLDWVNEVLVSVAIEKGAWTVEAAIPLEQLDSIGYSWIDRVRVCRPDAPELRWTWPAPNEFAYYSLPAGNNQPHPDFNPPSLPSNTAKATIMPPSDSFEADIAALPKQAWTEEERQLLGTEDMLENFLKMHMTEHAKKEKLAWQEVKTLTDWKRFREKRMDALWNWIGTMPEKTPLNPSITRRLDLGDGYIIENIVFESRPGMVVTANLYLPEKITAKIPALVVSHSYHSDRVHSQIQDMGTNWARAGAAVLVIDQLCFLERTQTQQRNGEGRRAPMMLGNQLCLTGESFVKWLVWDYMRGIDLLLERPYIDSKRIVILGGAAGGGDVAGYVAALDPRIAAVVPQNFGEAGPEEHYRFGPREYDFETAWPGWCAGLPVPSRYMAESVSGQYFPWFVAASVAPRGFIYNFEIDWPNTVEGQPAWARYKKVWELYGARDRLDEVHGFGPFPRGVGENSNFNTLSRRRIEIILNRLLDIPMSGTEYRIKAAEMINSDIRPQLLCLTPEAAFKYKPKLACSFVQEIGDDRLAESREKITRMAEPERRSAICEGLQEKLGDIEPMASAVAQKLWSKPGSNFMMEAYSLETEPGIQLPVFLLIPDKGVSPHPCVIGLAQEGKELFLSERYREIAALLEKGVAVCLPDLRGTGELSTAPRSSYRAYQTMIPASVELMLGRTLVGSQLKDTRTIFKWLSKRDDIDGKGIGLWGDSFTEPNLPEFEYDVSPGSSSPVEQRQAEPMGSFLALLTAMYEVDVAGVACRGGLVSFRSVLDDRFCHIPLDVVVPGLLEVADLRDMVRTVSPRPVLMEKLVDGRNKQVSLKRMEKEYAAPVPGLVLREDANSDLVGWLTQAIEIN
jgi:hypothetical protein